jgi:hypothetical protein
MERSNTYYIVRGFVRFTVLMLQAAGFLGLCYFIIVGLGA